MAIDLVPASLLAYHGRTFASLRKHRNYRLYFSGQIVSLSGTWMQDTALPWLVLERTHSAFDVGVLLFCRYLPFTVFGLSAGVVADRFDNRRFLLLTQLVSMTLASLLALVTLLGFGPLWLLYVVAAGGGAATVFDAPSRQALTYQLVGRAELPNAIALNSGLMNAARVVGPAIGGVIIAVAGVGICFVVNAASFLPFIAVLLAMRPDELFPVARSASPLRGVSAIREGLGFALRDPRLQMVLAFAAVVGLVGFNIRVLLPALAQKTLHVGADVFGALYASFGAGALAGALIAAGAHRPSWRLALVGSAVFSGAMLVLAPLSSPWAAGLLLFVVGVGFSVWGALSMTILQLGAPDMMRGRVISIYMFLFAGLAPLGSLLAGWLASVGGTGLAFAFAGSVGLVASALAWVRNRRLQMPEHPAPPEAFVEPVAALSEAT